VLYDLYSGTGTSALSSEQKKSMRWVLDGMGEFDSGTRGHRWPSRRQAVRPAARMTRA
jgi:hypothetical protein